MSTLTYYDTSANNFIPTRYPLTSPFPQTASYPSCLKEHLSLTLAAVPEGIRSISYLWLPCKAIDDSVELCKLAGAYARVKVWNMLFQDFYAREKYDSIWDCSSILYSLKDELADVLDGKVPTRVEFFTYIEDEIYQYCVRHAKENPFRGYMEFLHELQ